MCYSAQIWAEYKRYCRLYGARMDVATFAELFWSRLDDPKIKIPKVVEEAFSQPENAIERDICTAIEQYRSKQATKLEEELFAQRKRQADAERILAAKTTKAATEALRISTDKIAKARARLADLQRSELKDTDARIFPGSYVPVMIVEDGQRVIRPMRYGCRPRGKPADYDIKYPGSYNARRDNLDGSFWGKTFGYTHGLLVVNAFYEHVARPEGNVILEFRPRPTEDMLVACLWSHWTGAAGEPELYSFAMITDEPPEEVAAAGHDRCIIPIKPEHMDAWLNPNPKDLQGLYAILDDRQRPYYEHRLAA